ncbi:hypothetical protein [Nocardia lasii]|uniref:Uncharacterized protein n=1 Tax=Nocardia lasii TaxID=1616107 RepID=A0ABW1JNG9_9NOCA
MTSDLDDDPFDAAPIEPEEEDPTVHWPEPSPLHAWWADIMAAKKNRRFGQPG